MTQVFVVLQDNISPEGLQSLNKFVSVHSSYQNALLDIEGTVEHPTGFVQREIINVMRGMIWDFVDQDNWTLRRSIVTREI